MRFLVFLTFSGLFDSLGPSAFAGYPDPQIVGQVAGSRPFSRRSNLLEAIDWISWLIG